MECHMGILLEKLIDMEWEHQWGKKSEPIYIPLMDAHVELMM